MGILERLFRSEPSSRQQNLTRQSVFNVLLIIGWFPIIFPGCFATSFERLEKRFELSLE